MKYIQITSAFITKSFNDLKKTKSNTLTVGSCKKSESRSSCKKANGSINVKDVIYPVFVKFSPCRWNDFKENLEIYGISETTAKESPTYSEIKLFELTNALNKHGICDSFAFSYNYLLNDHVVKHVKHG